MDKKLLITLFLFSFCLPFHAQNYQRTAQGLKATTQEMDIAIEFYSPSIVRIYKTPVGKPYEKKKSGCDEITGRNFCGI